MEMKNICGKIPLELHAKVRGEIEEREISIQEFLQQVIEEHFKGKGVDSMVARTVAVQVTEELFGRLKAVIAWKGCKQKDFLISIIEKAIKEAEDELERERLGTEAASGQQVDGQASPEQSQERLEETQEPEEEAQEAEEEAQEPEDVPEPEEEVQEPEEEAQGPEEEPGDVTEEAADRDGDEVPGPEDAGQEA